MFNSLPILSSPRYCLVLSILGDDSAEDADVDAVITQIADRIGSDISKSADNDEKLKFTDAVTEFKTDLFGLKEGNT